MTEEEFGWKPSTYTAVKAFSDPLDHVAALLVSGISPLSSPDHFFAKIEKNVLDRAGKRCYNALRGHPHPRAFSSVG